MEIAPSNLSEIQDAIRKGELTCEDMVNFCLWRIEQMTCLNAFVEVWKNEALETAALNDAQIREGQWKPLFGAVLGLKDVLCYKGHEVTAGSRILGGFKSLYSSTAVERLAEAGAIFVGRLNCDEFAMGSSNENSYYGPVLNAADQTRVAGGSSGGSAAAVQADMCLAALGTDTGGSVRLPASFCGVVGLKPTYGAISRYGLLAYASSFDQIGVLSRNVRDATAILKVMAGKDEFDSTCTDARWTWDGDSRDQSAYSFACYRQAMESDGLDPAIRRRTEDLLGQLTKSGHKVEMVDFPYLDYLVPAYYVLTTAEASSNLARYDGVRFGFRATNASDVTEVYKKSRSLGFGKEVKRRIMLGTFVLSAGYYDAYYTKAQQVRRIIADHTAGVFGQFDFVISPTAASTAFRIGEKTGDPVSMYLSDIYTVQANLIGSPAISLPMGKGDDGLPFGIQLMAPRWHEPELLSCSTYLMDRFSSTITQ